MIQWSVFTLGEVFSLLSQQMTKQTKPVRIKYHFQISHNVKNIQTKNNIYQLIDFHIIIWFVNMTFNQIDCFWPLEKQNDNTKMPSN